MTRGLGNAAATTTTTTTNDDASTPASSPRRSEGNQLGSEPNSSAANPEDSQRKQPSEILVEDSDEGDEILVDTITTAPFAGSENGASCVDKSFHALYKLYCKELQASPTEDDKLGSPRILVAMSSFDSMDTGKPSPVPNLPSSQGEFEKDLLGSSSSYKRRSTIVTECAELSERNLVDCESDDNHPSSREVQRHDAVCGGVLGEIKDFHSRVMQRMHKAVVGALLAITGVAVRYPRTTLLSLGSLSIALVAAGWFTNFYVETQSRQLWPPHNTLTLEHASWIWQGSWFNNAPVQVDIIVHKNGDNVLGQEGVARVFEVQDTFVNFGEYKAGCAFAKEYGDTFAVGQCWINSVTDFWNESYPLFDATVQTDQDAIEILSQSVYPNGILVDVDSIMGNTERNKDGLLINCQSYLLRFGIPWSNSTLDFEARVLNRMLAMREEWIERGDKFRMEIRSHSSFSNEFLRAIWSDLWLFPITFGVVILFTILFAFGKCDKVKSRGLLGIGAVVTIVASMLASFGILFCIGIPFTTQTVMVPFLMFGIGLDDSFILYGSYHRRYRITDIKERIHSTVEDVGVSIFLTTLTSMLAFVLGSFSHIPAISWLCMYAVVSIGMDFVYQITFFVALLVLDERRIQQGRMDYCTCITVHGPRKGGWDDHVSEDEVLSTQPDQDDELHVAAKLMSWWASQLLKSWVQVFGFLVFVAIMGASILCATKLEQEFDFVAMVPQDSYLKTFYAVQHSYSTKDGIYGHAYFRDVDESDPIVQEQMLGYVDKLVASGKADDPVYMWVRDFQQFSAEQPTNSTFNDMTFDEQMDQFLTVDIYHDLYHDDISRNYNGTVMNTRVVLHFRFDTRDSKVSSHVMSTMREISAAEPINEGGNEWKFFTWAKEYFLYEFYDQVIRELIFTSVTSVVAVSVIAVLFIPHWTAVLFVFPFITCLYVNMLGFLYISGVQINAISYVTLVMSIGLMIDYIMHILMRYYDCEGSRQQRVQETMSSVGASIFLGATSTFLGIMCLSLSTSDILRDIFVAVVGLITFGVLHGLIFLPIALSRFGPQAKQNDVLLDNDVGQLDDPNFPQQQHPSPSLLMESTFQHSPTPLASPLSFTSDQTYEA